jgi:hypothetical protein
MNNTILPTLQKKANELWEIIQNDEDFHKFVELI